MVKALHGLCLKGGFTMTKWISNSRTVLQTIEDQHRAKDWKKFNLDRDELPVKRALGLQWSVELDALKFKMMLKEQAQSRRGLLSVGQPIKAQLTPNHILLMKGKPILASGLLCVCEEEMATSPIHRFVLEKMGTGVPPFAPRTPKMESKKGEILFLETLLL